MSKIEQERLRINAKLKTITSNVYFQTPGNTEMEYPAIVYSRKSLDTTKANNSIYFLDSGYQVSLISKDKNSPLMDEILSIPFSTYIRSFVEDNLNHDIFIIESRR